MGSVGEGGFLRSGCGDDVRGLIDGDCGRHYLGENGSRRGNDKHPSPGPFTSCSRLVGMGSEQRCEEMRSGGCVIWFREVCAEEAVVTGKRVRRVQAVVPYLY
jgi:hypothetical protein